jgi:hypothetical protein
VQREDRAALLVDELGIAVDEPDLGVALELLHHARDGPGQQRVVRAQPAKEIAGGALERDVERGGLAAVGAARPPRQPVLVAADDLDAAVRRAAVDDGILERRVVLRQHRLDRLLEERRLVVRRRDDADQRTAQAASTSSSYKAT